MAAKKSLALPDFSSDPVGFSGRTGTLAGSSAVGGRSALTHHCVRAPDRGRKFRCTVPNRDPRLFRAVEPADQIAPIFARSRRPTSGHRTVGQKSNLYREVPRKIHIFATPTGRTVPKNLVARMTSLRQLLGEKWVDQNVALADISSARVGFVGRRENFGRKFGRRVGRRDRPTTGSARRSVEENFSAPCPIAIRDFSPTRAPPTRVDQNRCAIDECTGGTYFITSLALPHSGAVWRLTAPTSASNEHRAVRCRINDHSFVVAPRYVWKCHR